MVLSSRLKVSSISVDQESKTVPFLAGTGWDGVGGVGWGDGVGVGAGRGTLDHELVYFGSSPGLQLMITAVLLDYLLCTCIEPTFNPYSSHSKG